jgi:O-antigen/teichoic acid export membrane protein
VSGPREVLSDWWQDGLLRRVIRNSSFLFSSNIISAGLSFGQGILAVRLVGVDGWGLVTTIITFASNVNRLLTFRMSEVVVKRLGESSPDKRDQAAAAVKTAMLTEALTSLAAYTILFLLAPWAARLFAKDLQTAPWFVIYGLILLTNLIYESSTGVLQAARRFDWIARINVIQSALTASLILAAFLLKGGVLAILLAYVIGKTFNGIAIGVAAWRELNGMLGPGWWRVPLRVLPEKRSMASFMLNTNLNGTVNLIVRDSIPLYLAALMSVTEVGYFKLAQSLVALVLLPLDPFIWPTYAEISSTVGQRQWDLTLRLLRRVSTLTAVVVLAVGGGLALTGWWLVPFLYGAAALPAYPALLILLVGFGFASIFQWNRPLMLALGKPGYPVLIAALVGVLELGLIFWLVPEHGYLMLAAILSGYLVFSIGITAWRGLKAVRDQRVRPMSA